MSKEGITNPYIQKRNEAMEDIRFWKSNGYSLEVVVNSLKKSLKEYSLSEAYDIVGREEFFKTIDENTSRIYRIATLWDKVEVEMIKPKRKWWQIFKIK